jgi:hypothetical protein
MKSKAHVTFEGFEPILSIKAALNRALPENLKSAFPHVVPMDRPYYTAPECTLYPNWISVSLKVMAHSLVQY